MFKIPLTLPVVFVLSWSALLGHFIENLSHKKKSLTVNEERSSVSVEMRRIWNLNNKRLPCIPEQWCWKFETRPQGSAPRLWVVKLEVWNPSVKQRRNFPRKIPRKLYYDGLRIKVWCGEWRKEATEKQSSLATFTSWFVLSFFLFWRKVRKHFNHWDRMINAYILNTLEHMVLAAIFHLKQNKSHFDLLWPWQEWTWSKSHLFRTFVCVFVCWICSS